jgi:asparagine synthase (glutamine-hydrolysing)
LQWTIALKKLKQSTKFPDSGIIVTGHDVAGSARDLPTYDDSTTSLDTEAVVDWILAHHYSIRHLDDIDAQSVMRDRIRNRITSLTTNDPAAAIDAIIEWYWRERTPKFLVRHVEEYRYWGYDRWIPLWDRELAEFWSSVSLKYRRGKALHEEYIRRLYEEAVGKPCRIARDGDSVHSKNLLSVLDRTLDYLPMESTVRGIYRRQQTRSILNSSNYNRFGFLSPRQFEELHPKSQHVKYFHALDRLSRIGCYPPHDSPLYEDLRLYESV